MEPVIIGFIFSIGIIVAVAVMAVLIPYHPPPMINYTAVVDDRVVASFGSGLHSRSMTVCVFIDHYGHKQTFSYPGTEGFDPCFLKIGDKIEVSQSLDPTFPYYTIVRQLQ